MIDTTPLFALYLKVYSLIILSQRREGRIANVPHDGDVYPGLPRVTVVVGIPLYTRRAWTGPAAARHVASTRCVGPAHSTRVVSLSRIRSARACRACNEACGGS